MWTGLIVVADVLPHDAPYMRLIQNQEMIQTLLSNCPHLPSRIGIRIRSPKGYGNDMNSFTPEDRVKSVGILPVIVANQETYWTTSR